MRRIALVPAGLIALAIAGTHSLAAKDHRISAVLRGNSASGHEQATSHQVSLVQSNPTLLTKYFDAGQQALDRRLYWEARLRFNQALQQVAKGQHDERLAEKIKTGLAEIKLVEENYRDALSTLSECRRRSDQLFGAESAETARLEYDMAIALLKLGKYQAAQEHCKESLEIRQKVHGENHHDTAMSQALLGQIQNALGFRADAIKSLTLALRVLQAHPGVDMQDYGEALYALGEARLAAGDEQGARECISDALSVKNRAFYPDSSPRTKGLLKYRWVEATPGCKQIHDTTYPLKYMIVGGVRVAATLVKSQKHLVAVISLANCTREPVTLAVGPVTIEKISPGREKLFYCDPNLIDLTLEEEYVQNYTWSRRWISHLLKTHRIPGYLKNGLLDQDSFFGNNIFGVYANWDGAPRTTPPMVTREQYYFGDQVALPERERTFYTIPDTRHGFRPTTIAPGDARTGIVVFLHKRYDLVRLNVGIGNAIVEFPFTAALGQERK